MSDIISDAAEDIVKRYDPTEIETAYQFYKSSGDLIDYLGNLSTRTIAFQALAEARETINSENTDN
mgnify:CR=1 FL=1